MTWMFPSLRSERANSSSRISVFIRLMKSQSVTWMSPNCFRESVIRVMRFGMGTIRVIAVGDGPLNGKNTDRAGAENALFPKRYPWNKLPPCRGNAILTNQKSTFCRT